MNIPEVSSFIAVDVDPCASGGGNTEPGARSPVRSEVLGDAYPDSSAEVEELRAAWDEYRAGSDLPLGDAFLFAAGFLAGRVSKSTTRNR
jgi:hypothetical protein